MKLPRITYAYHCRLKAYLTLIDGQVEEAHSDLVEFIESLETLPERLPKQQDHSPHIQASTLHR